MTAWYVNRSAGLVAWALLAASMALGILLSSKLLGKRVRPNWQLDLHRGLSGLAVAFTGVHVLGAIADNWVHFGWTEVLVPFTSSWRPLAVAWGVVTMYLLVAVEVTSLLRKRLSKRAWKAVHLSSYGLFLTATAHGISAGTDMGSTIGIAIAALVTAALAGLTAARVVEELDRKAHPAPARTSAARGALRTSPTAPAPVAPVASFAPPAPTPPAATATVIDHPLPTTAPHAAYVPPPAPPANAPADRVPARVGSPF